MLIQLCVGLMFHSNSLIHMMKISNVATFGSGGETYHPKTSPSYRGVQWAVPAMFIGP